MTDGAVPRVATKLKVSTAAVYAYWKLNRTGRGKRFIRKAPGE